MCLTLLHLFLTERMYFGWYVFCGLPVFGPLDYFFLLLLLSFFNFIATP